MHLWVGRWPLVVTKSKCSWNILAIQTIHITWQSCSWICRNNTFYLEDQMFWRFSWEYSFHLSTMSNSSFQDPAQLQWNKWIFSLALREKKARSEGPLFQPDQQHQLDSTEPSLPGGAEHGESETTWSHPPISQFASRLLAVSADASTYLNLSTSLLPKESLLLIIEITISIADIATYS